jgi:hypothetical protein
MLLADTMCAFAGGIADARISDEHRVEQHRENSIGFVGPKLSVNDRDAAVGAARQRLVVVPKLQFR